jgi:photosystem II stability/assembly factor-like uncharacterized protein
VSVVKNKLGTVCVGVAVATVILGQVFLPGADTKVETDRVEWSDRMPLSDRSLLLDVTVIGSRVIAVGERGHVLVSEDGGSKWTQARVPTRSMLTAVTTVDEQHSWVVGHDAVILASSNGGRDWVLQHLAPELDLPLLDVWFANASHGIAVGAYGLLLETHDGGRSWARRTISQQEPHLYAITEGRDGTLYIAGESGSLYRSRDSGRSWTALTSPYSGSFFGAIALSNGGLLVFGLRGNLYRSEDQGQTWRRLETGTTASLMGGTERTDRTVVMVGLSGTVLVSRDGGHEFVLSNRRDGLGLANVAELSGGRLVTAGEAGIGQIDKLR